MQQHDQLDFSSIDLRTLSPTEWDAIRKEIFRRARRERDQAVGDALARTWRAFRRLLKWSALRATWISQVRKRRERSPPRSCEA